MEVLTNLLQMLKKPSRIVSFAFICIGVYFVVIAISLLLGIIFDAILSSIAFIFTGNFILVSEVGFNFYNQENILLSQENFRINTDLKGLDFLVNSFFEYQYSLAGRWRMLSCAVIVAAPFTYLADKIDNTVDDYTVENYTPDNNDKIWAGILLMLALVAISPFILSIFIGFKEMILNPIPTHLS